jgi:ubiquinone/menaquinone biosynthesis C-methylase UbiE
MAYRAENARAQYPNFNSVLNNAEHLPFAENQFELVTQFTVFSSILEPEMRAHVAAEMCRVLQRNGLILWYDMKTHYPPASSIQGIGKKHLADLFPDMIPLEIRPLHHRLAPITARRLPWVADLLEYLPFTGRTHLLMLLRKP